MLTRLESFAGWIVVIFEVKAGAGRHFASIGNMDQIHYALHLNFVTQVIYLWAIGVVKVSIGLFLTRFAMKKGYKIFIWTVIIVMALYTTICFFVRSLSLSLSLSS